MFKKYSIFLLLLLFLFYGCVRLNTNELSPNSVICKEFVDERGTHGVLQSNLSATHKFSVFYDHCYDDYKGVKYSCTSKGGKHAYEFICNTGEKCVNGACVKVTENINTSETYHSGSNGSNENISEELPPMPPE